MPLLSAGASQSPPLAPHACSLLPHKLLNCFCMKYSARCRGARGELGGGREHAEPLVGTRLGRGIFGAGRNNSGTAPLL